MGRFKEYLLTEERNFLGKRVGDVLSAMQDLGSDMENMGIRHISRVAEEIVNRMRKILHGDWTPKQRPFLIQLQKIAVAIQKTIEDKGDIKQILQAASQELEGLSGKIGTPVNKLKAPEQSPGEEPQMQLTGPDPAQGPQPGQDQGMPPGGPGGAPGQPPSPPPM